MHRGYARLWRKSVESDVWEMSDATWRVWCWCLMSATHKPMKIHGRLLEPGQFLTGRYHGSERCRRMKRSTWLDCMKRLEDAGNITRCSDRYGTLVTIVKYSLYNDEDEDPRQVTDNQPTTNRQPTDTKPTQWTDTDKHNSTRTQEHKSTKVRASTAVDGPSLDSFDKFWQEVPNKVGKQAARKAFAKAVARVALEKETPSDCAAGGILLAMMVYRISPKGKGRYSPHPARWLNEGRYDDDPATWQDDGAPTTRSARNIATARKLLKEDADGSQAGNNGSLGAALRELQSGTDPGAAGNLRPRVGGPGSGQDP